MVSKTQYLNPALSILALCSILLATTVLAENKNLLLAEDRTLIEESDDGGLEKTLEHNFSPDDRARLRKALADYAKSTDPVHTQIEQKRKAMQESIEKRFNECNKETTIHWIAKKLPYVCRRSPATLVMSMWMKMASSL